MTFLFFEIWKMILWELETYSEHSRNKSSISASLRIFASGKYSPACIDPFLIRFDCPEIQEGPIFGIEWFKGEAFLLTQFVKPDF